MVSYQVWTSICFEVAKSKGARFSGISDGGQFVKEIAQYWRDNPELKGFTKAQARSRAEEVVTS